MAQVFIESTHCFLGKADKHPELVLEGKAKWTADPETFVSMRSSRFDRSDQVME